MRKCVSLLLLLAAVTGGYLLRDYTGSMPFEFNLTEKSDRKTSISILEIPQKSLFGETTPETIRIASFNIESFGLTKAGNTNVMDLLARIVRQFDIVAIQEIRSKDQTLIPSFVSQINANGSKYEYELGPRLGRSSSKEQYVFIFNSETIEIDRQATYTVSDPHDRMHREPLVSLFRVRTNNPSTAFTFKLINVHIDPDDVQEEMNTLRDVYRVVLEDEDQEDDVILLGDFNTNEKQLFGLGTIPGLSPAIENKTTNTSRTQCYDNFFFHNLHTREFNGKSGVVDLVRIFNLTTEQALAVSDHFPIWAEFSIFEGGQRGPTVTPIHHRGRLQ